MSILTVLIIILLVVLLLGGGWGYYGNPSWRGGPVPGVAGLIIGILVVLLILHLAGVLA